MSESHIHDKEENKTTPVSPERSTPGEDNDEPERDTGYIGNDAGPELRPGPVNTTTPKKPLEVFRKTELHQMIPSLYIEQNRASRDEMLERLRQSVSKILSLQPGASWDEIIAMVAKKQDGLDREFNEHVFRLMAQIDNHELELERVQELLEKRIQAVEWRIAALEKRTRRRA